MELFKWVWSFLSRLNESGQIPSTLTDDYGALLTTTLRNMQPKLHDNITRGNKYLAYLDSKGRFRKVDGGERIQVALMHAQNSTADIYQGYGLLNTTPQDGITSAFFDWTQLSVSITISRKEERQNSGKSKAIGLLQSKTTQAEASIKELLNNCLLSGRITSSSNLGQFLQRRGTIDTSAVGPMPLPALIDSNASRSVAIGNINGNTHSFWRNQADSSTATTFAGFKLELNNIYNDCSKGQGGSPDFMIADQSAWETYWGSLQNQERFVVDDKKTLDILGGADALKFRGAIIVWDEVTPDTETNATIVDAVGTHTVSSVFLVNSSTIEWITDAETDFMTTPMLRPENQDARTGQILWMGAMGINERRKNGVLYGIVKTITA